MTVISELWRYPVKSMGGERLHSATLGDKLPGDRDYGVFDAASGRLLSAKTLPALLQCSARGEGNDMVITLADGAEISPVDPDVDVVLSERLGRALTLRRVGRGGVADSRSTVEIELDDGSGHDDATREVGEFTTGSTVGFFDGRSTIHLISEASLAALDDAGVAGSGDARRYRPNVVVSGSAAFAEEGWVETTIRIGDAALYVRKRTGRCVMVGRAQPELGRDRAILRFINHERAGSVGISCDPTEHGVVSVGDRLHP